ncbi:MAG: pyridoxamine 5'-phosphate oxidase family protein [Bacteroidota bacterium]
MNNPVFTDPERIKFIIDKCDVCYIGMADENNMPYVLPFNFAYENNILYFHTGPGGMKLNILKKNPNLCVSFSTDHKLFFRNESVACSYAMKYRSVIAFGKVEFVEDYDEKIKCMNIIMQKYTGKDFPYNAPSINNLVIFKLNIEKIEGKELGY